MIQFRRLGLRYQIIMLVLAFTLAVGIGNTLRTHVVIRALAREQFEHRSAAFAAALAARAADPMLTDDVYALYKLMRDARESDPDVRYIAVLDAHGRVRSHTFGQGIPRGLLQANAVVPGEQRSTRTLSTNEGEVLDIAVPLPGAESGSIRVGMSYSTIEAVIRRHTSELLALTSVSLIPVLVASYLVGRAITRPLHELEGVATAIGRGDMTRAAPEAGGDEVARLGLALNSMTRDLVRVQGALEATNRELAERNEALSALYETATATAYTESMDDLARAALTSALDVLGLSSGWLILRDDAPPSGWSLRAVRGLTEAEVRRLRSTPPDACIADDWRELGSATVAHSGAACPVLSSTPGGGDRPCHATVPLRTVDQVYGALSLACPDTACFTTDRLRLLTAIGRQVGMALENAQLAESHIREAVHRRLLDQVIAAQEDERKRIARELHDELAQSLAALIRELESVVGDKTDPSGGAARIRDTRDLAVRILEQTRRLIFDLRPTALDDLGLLPAIRRYAVRSLEPDGISVHVESMGRTRRVASSVETGVFRIAQEAITNIKRHARASRVQVRLETGVDCLCLTVADDGVGFDTSQVLSGSDAVQRMGIMGMRERAELLGGHLQIEARPRQGATIRVEVPIEDNDSDTRPAG